MNNVKVGIFITKKSDDIKDRDTEYIMVFKNGEETHFDSVICS